jgi:hypothetical protein
VTSRWYCAFLIAASLEIKGLMWPFNHTFSLSNSVHKVAPFLSKTHISILVLLNCVFPWGIQGYRLYVCIFVSVRAAYTFLVWHLVLFAISVLDEMWKSRSFSSYVLPVLLQILFFGEWNSFITSLYNIDCLFFHRSEWPNLMPVKTMGKM